MNSAKFADALITSVVDMNSMLYARMFDDELLADRPRDDLDPEFVRSLSIYAKLTYEEQEVLIRRFRQIAIDSVSSVLGIIDGSSTCNGFPGPFSLEYDGETIGNGELQDAFLERIEEIDQR